MDAFFIFFLQIFGKAARIIKKFVKKWQNVKKKSYFRSLNKERTTKTKTKNGEIFKL